eukprot:TRINITY_DN1685_c1_g1_i2.p1 TRINITY_DN1685_c1_g1~~TRINITY_DN1685_c1_g1_i2.p1  ORF type:complete len:361 (-),score=141.57 TRINITY_DN1685_c1_g1_i2:496-1578(-)
MASAQQTQSAPMKRVPSQKTFEQAAQPTPQAPAKPALKETVVLQLEKAKQTAELQLGKAKKTAAEGKERVVKLVKDPEFHKLTISTGSGALVLGSAGGAFGAVSGVMVGGATGILPALFTFGLSIPAGALAGGVTGFFVGSSCGGSAGLASGYGLYKYRVELKDGVLTAKVKLLKNTERSRAKVLAITDMAKTTATKCTEKVTTKAKAAVDYTKVKAEMAADFSKMKANKLVCFTKAKAADTYVLATTTRPGVSATAAVAGGAAGSAAGGAIGAVAGAAVGVVPALFTFGLSIPVGAAIGACAGATAGGSAGLVGGGAVGFAGFTYKKEIKDSAKYMKLKAIDSFENVKSLVVSGTGGTM